MSPFATFRIRGNHDRLFQQNRRIADCRNLEIAIEIEIEDSRALS